METAIPLVRSHSVSTLVVHVVWATAGRACVLTPELDDVLGGWLVDKAQECGSRVLVAGNASDHVHLLVQHPPAMPVAELVRLLKGSSSDRAGVVYGHSSGVRWQAGYWAESVSPDQLTRLARYVRRQREHHANSMAAEPWEVERPTR